MTLKYFLSIMFFLLFFAKVIFILFY